MSDHQSRAAEVLKAVVLLLAEYPDGLTLRALSKQSNVKLSTLRYHLDRSLAGYIVDTRIGPAGKPYLRLIRLKPGAMTKANLVLQNILRDLDR